MYGFIRVAAAIPKLKVGNCVYNSTEILKLIHSANEKKIKILAFPELSMTGYTCSDLFYQSALLDACEESVAYILSETKDLDIFITIGLPVRYKNRLYNCAASIYKGTILGITPKIAIPNDREFYEKRWFDSGEGLKNCVLNYCNQSVAFGSDILYEFKNFRDLIIGVEICADLWTAIPPSCYQSQAGANIIINLSASNEIALKSKRRETLISAQSERLNTTYIYSSAGIYESTTDLLFSGHSLIYENGVKLAENKGFSLENQLIYCDTDIELLMQTRRISHSHSSVGQDSFYNNLQSNYSEGFNFLQVDLKNDSKEVDRFFWKKPFVPNNEAEMLTVCEEVFKIQFTALAKRLLFTKGYIESCVIGISGGLDSTLALLCTIKAFDYLGMDRKSIIGITMPGFGTTDRTYNNAIKLMEALGITSREISIKESCLLHFKDIGHDVNVHDVTYENAQARERTQILMDIATKENALVIGTGDLSELALGFATYNGDHMSMYAVNSGVPKTLIRKIVEWVSGSNLLDAESSNVLLDIVNTPVSPELLPPNKDGLISQVTENIVGPYELHDFYLYYALKYGFSPDKIAFLAELAFKGEYSREEIVKWMKVFYKRFFSQQFKRSCMPDGPKVLDISLSPRGDLRMPSDASCEIWLT